MKKLFQKHSEEKNKFIFMAHGPDNFDPGSSERSESQNKKPKSNDKFSPKAINKKLTNIGKKTDTLPGTIPAKARGHISKLTQDLVNGVPQSEAKLRDIMNAKPGSGNDTSSLSPKSEGETKEQGKEGPKGKERVGYTPTEKKQIKAHIENIIKKVRQARKEYEDNLKKEKRDSKSPEELKIQKRFDKATKVLTSFRKDVDSAPEKKENESGSEDSEGSGGLKAAMEKDVGVKEGTAEADAAAGCDTKSIMWCGKWVEKKLKDTGHENLIPKAPASAASWKEVAGKEIQGEGGATVEVKASKSSNSGFHVGIRAGEFYSGNSNNSVTKKA